MVTNLLFQNFNYYLFLKAEFDACKQNPCMNGATCLSQSQFSYKCLCPLGFEGKNCTSKHFKSNKFHYSIFIKKKPRLFLIQKKVSFTKQLRLI